MNLVTNELPVERVEELFVPRVAVPDVKVGDLILITSVTGSKTFAIRAITDLTVVCAPASRRQRLRGWIIARGWEAEGFLRAAGAYALERVRRR